MNTQLSDIFYARAVFFRERRSDDVVRVFLDNERTMLRLYQMNLASSTLFIPTYLGDLSSVVVSLTSQQINSFTENVVVPPERRNEVCSICQDSLQSSQACRILRCSHMLHRTCANQWFAISVRCPICRADLRETNNQPNNNTNEHR
jgi:Ring finger domain